MNGPILRNEEWRMKAWTFQGSHQVLHVFCFTVFHEFLPQLPLYPDCILKAEINPVLPWVAWDRMFNHRNTKKTRTDWLKECLLSRLLQVLWKMITDKYLCLSILIGNLDSEKISLWIIYICPCFYWILYSASLLLLLSLFICL